MSVLCYVMFVLCLFTLPRGPPAHTQTNSKKQQHPIYASMHAVFFEMFSSPLPPPPLAPPAPPGPTEAAAAAVAQGGAGGPLPPGPLGGRPRAPRRRRWPLGGRASNLCINASCEFWCVFCVPLEGSSIVAKEGPHRHRKKIVQQMMG